MKELITNLINFILGNGGRITKTKKGIGFMIYNPSQITDVAQLEGLASQLDWRVIQSDDEWDRGTKVRSASIYVGPVSSDLDLKDADSALAYIESQLS